MPDGLDELVAEAVATVAEFGDKAAPLRALAWKLEASAGAGG